MPFSILWFIFDSRHTDQDLVLVSNVFDETEETICLLNQSG
jgi:hypothetical protein